MDARPSRPRFVFLLLTTVLLLFSILTITLYSSVLVFISNPIVGLSQVINFFEQSHPVVQVLPDHLSVTSLKVALASGAFSLVVSSFWVIFAVWFWPNGKRVSNSKAYDFYMMLEIPEYYDQISFVQSIRNTQRK